ncbi:MAG TPA: PhnD/SsuA/transferrin family substrate-binding protein [Planctomycetota bacterium]|nr:PhnD/SsuA/transferrin family substrate-binding protein [Planctomycetota bacterium]
MKHCVVFLLLLLAAPAIAGDEMILVYPGKPGTQEQAKPVLKSFTDYVETRAGWQSGALHATYYNNEPDALAVVNGDKPPQYAILSLSVYLKWKKAGKQMTILAQSELDKKPTMQFHLLVPKDSKIKDLESLKGASVASSFMEDRDFASKIIFGGAIDATKDISIIDTKSMTTMALPACANFKPLKKGGRVDALLVDDDLLEGMRGKEIFNKMRIAWSSQALPTPPVVTFQGANGPKAAALLGALRAMAANSPGREILKDLTATGFLAPNLPAYAAVEKAY